MPSAGKSTLINSLIGKRMLRTGVCRTTKEVHVIGPADLFNVGEGRFHEHAPMCDDDISFSIVDLPGVADAENNGTGENDFNEVSLAWSTNCDVLCWYAAAGLKHADAAVHERRLSQGVGRADGIPHTHEQEEFDKIHDHLVNVSRETDALYQMCIVLSKYDYDDEHSPKKPGVSVQYGDEIVDEDEVCSVPSMV